MDKTPEGSMAETVQMRIPRKASLPSVRPGQVV